MKILHTEAVNNSDIKKATAMLRSNLYSTSTVTGNTVAENLEAANYYTEQLAEHDKLHPELISSYESLRKTAIRRTRNQAKMLIAQCEELIKGANIALELIGEIEGAAPVNESVLKEGNPVSGELPPRVDAWLQDVAQMTNKINYGDIMKIRYTDENKKKLRHWHKKWNIAADEDNQDEMDHIGELVKKLVK